MFKQKEEKKKCKKEKYHPIALNISSSSEEEKTIYKRKIQRFCEFDNNFVGNQTVKLL